MSHTRYMKGTFLDIYRGQKIWQTYRFDRCHKENSYEEFRKDEYYFIWTSFRSTNPHEEYYFKDKWVKSSSPPPIIDISETGYYSSIMPSIALDLPDRVEDLHGYMIKKLSVHNIEIMKERLPTYNGWHKNHNKTETSGQQDLLLL